MAVPKQFLGQWRSIEFEVIFNNQASILKFKELIKDKPYKKLVSYKVDYSIHPRDEYIEVAKEVILTYRAGQEEYVRDFCQTIKGLAYVNNSCGTHVHFDMRHVNEETALLYGARLGKVVPALRMLLPPSRRDNRFCIADINTIEGPKTGAARYAFINMKAYSKYKTIEVRGHSGTLNASKILNWIAVCEKIMTTDKVLRNKIKTTSTLLKHYEFAPELVKYINKRGDKFNAVDGEAE